MNKTRPVVVDAEDEEAVLRLGLELVVHGHAALRDEDAGEGFLRGGVWEVVGEMVGVSDSCKFETGMEMGAEAIRARRIRGGIAGAGAEAAPREAAAGVSARKRSALRREKR